MARSPEKPHRLSGRGSDRMAQRSTPSGGSSEMKAVSEASSRSSAPSSAQVVVGPTRAAAPAPTSASLPAGLPFGQSVAIGSHARSFALLSSAAASASQTDSKSGKPHHYYQSQNPPPSRARGRGGRRHFHQGHNDQPRPRHDQKLQWNGRENNYRGRDERSRNMDDSQSWERHRQYQNSSSYREYHRDHSDHSRGRNHDYYTAGQNHYFPEYTNYPNNNDYYRSRNYGSLQHYTPREITDSAGQRQSISSFDYARGQNQRCEPYYSDYRFQSGQDSHREECKGDYHAKADSHSKSDNEMLKHTLEKIELETKIQAALLEKKKVEQLVQMQENQSTPQDNAASTGPLARPNPAGVAALPFAAIDTTLTTSQQPVVRPLATIETAAPTAHNTATAQSLAVRRTAVSAARTDDGDDDIVDFSTTMHTADDSSDDSYVATANTARMSYPSTARPLAVRESTASTAPSPMDNDVVDVSATVESLDEDEQVPPRRAKDAPKRKKPVARNSRRAKLTRNLERKREAKVADDEPRKNKLLQARDVDMALLSEGKSDMHQHSELDLMSTFTPEIVDHYLPAKGGVAKYLVGWKCSGRVGQLSGQSCLTWVSHEDFLFPALAGKYLDDKKLGAVWIKQCVEREQCLKLLNSATLDNDEYESQVEIDFCCYLCKCPWDHPMKNTTRNCEYGLKFHRGCCHGLDKDTLESFVSPVGQQVLEQFSGSGIDEGTTGADESHTLVKVEERSDAVLEVVGGDSSMYSRSLRDRKAMRERQSAVVLCLNAGVGSATVSLKALGMQVGKIIHVDRDRLAQHVFRSNHDIRYGDTEVDDGIEHVVGLYESFYDVADDPEKVVLQYGPIDIVMCSTVRGLSREESVQFTSNFFMLVDDIKRLNMQHFQVDHLFYLLEVPSNIKDELPSRDFTRCVCESSVFLCNWPISSQSLVPVSGLQFDDVFHPVTDLFDSLRDALCAGPWNKLWRDEIHPKYWSFLGLGPNGYGLKLEKREFDYTFSLRLRSPNSADLLSAFDYSNYLLETSPSVPLLIMILSPMKGLFGDKQYGPRYDEMIPEHEKCELLRDKEPGSPVSSIATDAVENLPAVKLEVKEDSTDDEAALFDRVDESIARI